MNDSGVLKVLKFIWVGYNLIYQYYPKQKNEQWKKITFVHINVKLLIRECVICGSWAGDNFISGTSHSKIKPPQITHFWVRKHKNEDPKKFLDNAVSNVLPFMKRNPKCCSKISSWVSSQSLGDKIDMACYFEQKSNQIRFW